MIVNLLGNGYKKSEDFYHKFVNNELKGSEFVTNENVTLYNELKPFEIYFGKIGRNDEVKATFVKTIKYIAANVIDLDRDIYMNETFWHSWLCLYQRDYLVAKYPEILTDYKKFLNIVLKDFDWENYIYKAILIAQYTADYRPPEKAEEYYDLIINNLDLYNYIIKAEIFRNGQFLLNVMDIIKEEKNLSKIVKAKIKNTERDDLAKDERYGRRVIKEFNASYPIVPGPMLEKDELKKYFLLYLSYYYKEGDVDLTEDESEDDSEQLELFE